MALTLSFSMPAEEDLQKYLPEYLAEKFPGETEFCSEDITSISKDYLSWLFAKTNSFQVETHNLSAKRNRKGTSLLLSTADYTALDIETTGLDPRYDEIIEIAAIRYRQGVIAEKFQTLVKPINEIDEFITELTGITNNMLASAPDLESVLSDFLEFLGNDIIVGHNVNFDINFIYDNCYRILHSYFSNNFIDTMRLSRRLFSNLPNHKLQTLVSAFAVDDSPEHRALSDSVCASGCYEYMKKYAFDNNIDLNARSFSNTHSVSAKDISTHITEFNQSSPVYNKVFVFTGVLEKMVRKDAMQIVVDLGGRCADGVNKSVNYLVLGNNDYCSTIKDGKSTKQKKAEKLLLLGSDIQIISENVFYDMIAESKLEVEKINA